MTYISAPPIKLPAQTLYQGPLFKRCAFIFSSTRHFVHKLYKYIRYGDAPFLDQRPYDPANTQLRNNIFRRRCDAMTSQRLRNDSIMTYLLGSVLHCMIKFVHMTSRLYPVCRCLDGTFGLELLRSDIVCVEVLRPSQPNGVMSSAVSLPNQAFTGQA